MADRIAVMYLGRIVEIGTVEDITQKPQHPYTISLLQAILTLKPNTKNDCLKGEQPSPINPPKGCHFHPRCPRAMSICQHHYPPAKTLKNNHLVACHLV